MRSVILCGGAGTRAYPQSLEVPKPLLKVGDRPILLHLMEIYARQGHTDFVLAAGYLANLIAEFAAGLDRPWRVEVVDTGEAMGTAGRIKGCADLLGETFMATYGDGLAPVDLSALLAFHDSHPGAVTVTAVPLPSPYGTLQWDETGRVERFIEKPRLTDHWINAGYFVFDKRAFDLWSGDDLEREVLPAIAAEGELYVYQHRGFWRSLDTYKDSLELSELWRKGDGPWTIFPTPESSSPVQPDSSGRTSPGDSSNKEQESTR